MYECVCKSDGDHFPALPSISRFRNSRTAEHWSPFDITPCWQVAVPVTSQHGVISQQHRYENLKCSNLPAIPPVQKVTRTINRKRQSAFHTTTHPARSASLRLHCYWWIITMTPGEAGAHNHNPCLAASSPSRCILIVTTPPPHGLYIRQAGYPSKQSRTQNVSHFETLFTPHSLIGTWCVVAPIKGT